jgi:hypothetical protein
LASSFTLPGRRQRSRKKALENLARYSATTNEALVVEISGSSSSAHRFGASVVSSLTRHSSDFCGRRPNINLIPGAVLPEIRKPREHKPPPPTPFFAPPTAANEGVIGGNNLTPDANDLFY